MLINSINSIRVKRFFSWSLNDMSNCYKVNGFFVGKFQKKQVQHYYQYFFTKVKKDFQFCFGAVAIGIRKQSNSKNMGLIRA